MKSVLAFAAFYERLNELLELIRRKHAGCRLLYNPHPGETDESSFLDLEGFDHAAHLTSESLVNSDRSITTLYSVTSTSTLTSVYYGARGHWLYPLFDESVIAPEVVRLWNDMFGRCLPGMCLTSEEGWMQGKYDYDVPMVSNGVRDSVVKVLRDACIT